MNCMLAGELATYEPVRIENVMVLLNSLWVDLIRYIIMTSVEGVTERAGREVYHCPH